MQSQRSLIHLEGFEGPFDLLLELIRERKLDVSTLSLREITDDFLMYLETNTLRPELLGDFLVVAATLLLLKTRALLPQLPPEEEEEIEQLKARLALYHQYREQGHWLTQQWESAPLFSVGSFAPYSRSTLMLNIPSLPPAYLADLLTALMSRLPRLAPARVQPNAQGKSLQECLDLFWSRLAHLRQLVFQQVVAGNSRQDVAISFLAVLELARQQRVQLTQAAATEEIIITPV